ncbi:MAG: DUF1858 domain-containing protein [Candidatus ainarchaeum sp.]|nr:DUF1858 domain-containing protein [Candidatus ainarchaeum sp.]
MAKEKGLVGEGMLISEVVSLYPQTIPVFMEFGLHCIGCSVAASETVGDGARSHGMDGKRLAAFLRALNIAAGEKEVNGGRF